LLFRLPSSALFSWKECQQLRGKVTTMRTLDSFGGGGSDDIDRTRLLFRLCSSGFFFSSLMNLSSFGVFTCGSVTGMKFNNLNKTYSTLFWATEARPEQDALDAWNIW
jgi:hypothetical protein